MGKKQREKGKRLEREAVKLLSEHGIPCRRSVQYAGKAMDSSDVQLITENSLRVEVKGGYNEVETHHATVGKWIEKLKEEAEVHGQTPILLWRKDRRPWLAILPTPHPSIVMTHDIGLALDLCRAEQLIGCL